MINQKKFGQCFVFMKFSKHVFEVLSWINFCNRTSLETTSLQPLDSIKTYVKKGEFNTDGFVAKNDSVIVTTQCNCMEGQMLKRMDSTEYCGNYCFYKKGIVYV